MSPYAFSADALAVARARLHTQGLTRPLAGTATDIMRQQLAVQSQDYIGGKWSVALRLADPPTASTLERELDAGRILRTHVLRPTWHFVLPEDIRWLLAATSPRVLARNAPMARKLGLDARTLAKALEIIARELEGGRWRTREELGEALGRERIKDASGQRLTYIAMQAELEGLMVSGPRRGKQFTYGLMDERAPRAGQGSEPPRTHDDGLVRLATRYFIGHGPATAIDLARWATLTSRDAARAARLALEAAGGALEMREREGVRRYAAAGAHDPPRGRGIPPSRRGHLLSVFDEYVNGYRDRSMIVTAAHGGSIVGAGNAVLHVYVIDGRVLGTWTREFAKEAVRIEVAPFDRLTKRDRTALGRALAPSAERYGRFVGSPADLAVLGAPLPAAVKVRTVAPIGHRHP